MDPYADFATITGSAGRVTVTTPQVKQQAPVDEHLGRIDSRVDGLHSMVDELERQLAGALGEAAPDTASDAVNTGIGSSPLAGALGSIEFRLASVQYRLRRLIDRIEL